MCMNEVLTSAWWDPILSLGVRWQRYAGLGDMLSGLPPKCYIHGERVFSFMV